LIRHTKEDRELEIGGGRKRTVPGNSTVIAITASAVVDPTLVPHPGEFLIGRPPAQQLVFGTGQHQCTGGTLQRPIAQMLMTEMTAALFALPNLKRAPGKRGRIQNEGRWPAHFQVVGEAGNA
jgi:cytochrome P450